MTYYELFTKAENLLIKNKISLGEYDKMVQPLNEEVRKSGRWVRLGNCEYKCPCCGKVIFADDVNERNYCPNCGMKGE